MRPPEDEAGDGPLVAAAQRDPRAFAILYDRYERAILNYCYYRLGDWEDAEDAAQQVFTNTLAGLKRFRDQNDSFRSWLFRIAHNEVANRHRDRAHHAGAALTAALGLADRDPSPETLAMLADDQRRVRTLLARLPDEQRRVCELRLAGLSGREIADALGLSHVAVRKAQSRATARLRDLMGIGVTRTETPGV